MTNDETVEELHVELARQDEQLAAAVAELQMLGGDTSLPFPAEWLRDFEEACHTHAPYEICQPLALGIRA